MKPYRNRTSREAMASIRCEENQSTDENWKKKEKNGELPKA